MSKRIILLVGLLVVAVFEIQKIFPRSLIHVEVPNEATTTGKITAGEMISVSKIIDGDTVELVDGRRVRYIGIDAPEIAHEQRQAECFSREAAEENRRWVEGKTVRLEKDASDVDTYGRLLRYVYVGDTMVNELLVIGGFAKAWLVPPDEKLYDAFMAAQFEARQMSRGLWQACRR